MKTLLTLLALILLSNPGPANAWSLYQVQDDSKSFLFGLIGGYLAHETGHILVAKSKGYRVTLKGANLTYPQSRMTNSDHFQVSSAGFQAQWLTSEAAFLYRNKKILSLAEDNLTAGLICSHLLISAAYLTVLNNHPDGDLYGMADASSLATGQLAALIAIPAILDSWRLWGEDVPKWVPLLSVSSKGAGLIVAWTF